MSRRFGTNYAVLSVLADAIAVSLALWLSEELRPDLLWLPWSRPIEDLGHQPIEAYAATALLWVAVFFLARLYDPGATERMADELRILIVGSSFAALTTAGLLFLSFRDVSRWLFLLFAIIAVALLVGWRLAARVLVEVLDVPAGRRRTVLIAGGGPIGRYVGQSIEARAADGWMVVGYLDDDPSRAEGLPLLGPLSAARAVAESVRVDELVIALPGGGGPSVDKLVGDLIDIPLRVRVVPECFFLALDRPAIEHLAGIPTVDLRAGPLNSYQRVVKRIFDLVVGAGLILVTLPVMVAVAIAIKLDTPGPVLFTQRRVGENNRHFTMYKFRSMIDGALPFPPGVEASGPRRRLTPKMRDDPRVTRVGRFLRRSSLDEFPQFFNVLRGDMSLVGPRPELPGLVAEYEGWQRRRLVVPPGMTGWWQVNGRSLKPMHLHTDEDIYYISNYSLWLDLRILTKTVNAVLRGKGAY